MDGLAKHAAYGNVLTEESAVAMELATKRMLCVSALRAGVVKNVQRQSAL